MSDKENHVFVLHLSSLHIFADVRSDSNTGVLLCCGLTVDNSRRWDKQQNSPDWMQRILHIPSKEDNEPSELAKKQTHLFTGSEGDVFRNNSYWKNKMKTIFKSQKSQSKEKNFIL